MSGNREVIWAPWRKQYVIRGDKDSEGGCVFCRAARAGSEREKLVLRRGEHCFLMLNLYPYNNGHLMVVPNRHASDLADLPDGEVPELMFMARRALAALKTCLRPDGFNIGFNIGAAAGAGIAAHLHLHVVPRWNGDTNFMPVTGAVKAIPDSLDALYGELDRVL